MNLIERIYLSLAGTLARPKNTEWSLGVAFRFGGKKGESWAQHWRRLVRKLSRH